MSIDHELDRLVEEAKASGVALSLSDWRWQAVFWRREAERLRHAIAEHRLCSQGWREASAVDRDLWKNEVAP